MEAINYGKACACQKQVITVCIKCELYDSLKIANAFALAGYDVKYGRCKKHDK